MIIIVGRRVEKDKCSTSFEPSEHGHITSPMMVLVDVTEELDMRLRWVVR